ncbi:MAG: NifU family protein [Candidatus Omnitrophica bacterium]|nr:NifU family protein [Candidatus Omnitrophota bacterium]MBU1851703.1 NifU family protein [Candidatus Omnitrophota bacterium]
MEELVKTAIEKIRPVLQRDGGDIEFVTIEDGIVKVKLQGACRGCPMSQMTVKTVVERAIKDEVPEVKGVETVA